MPSQNLPAPMMYGGFSLNYGIFIKKSAFISKFITKNIFGIKIYHSDNNECSTDTHGSPENR